MAGVKRPGEIPAFFIAMSRIAYKQKRNLAGRHNVFIYRRVEDRGAAMGFVFYIVMFIVACGFGWWAKGAEKSR